MTKETNVTDGIQIANQLMLIWGDYPSGPKVITSILMNERWRHKKGPGRRKCN